MSKTWFITGASRGFGREWAHAALERGDHVAATARDTDDLEALTHLYGSGVLPLQLDVTNRDACFATVQQAAEHFGSLDVVVNNAGYGHFGMVEELTEPEIRAQLETNFFGTLWVTQAALPIMRQQRSGHLLQVTSEGGVVAFPGIGAYHASKWAVEGLSQALAGEVAGLGIHVTLVEPGPYATDWMATGARRSEAIGAYEPVRRGNAERTWDVGAPAATRQAILRVVDADNPPLRVLFGRSALAGVQADYESRLALWEQWQPLSVAAHG